MKKFFVMYMAKSEDFQKVMAQMGSLTPEQQKEMNDEWGTWMKGAGVVDEGSPLGKTKRVTESSVEDAKNEIGGYSIIEAESHDEAAKKMQSNPHFKMIPGGWIDVMEIMPM
ncbi:MAG: hypothetical protein JO019_03875 [Candidatus Kaiserbacteria bacterium]|nr:hypothetical protein [Candidatus Kaiserbacteria bacterium]